MALKNIDFIKFPSKKLVVSFTILWFIGFTFLLLAATDLFTANPLKTEYAMLYFMTFVSALFMVLLNINYQKNKSIKNDLTQ
jgi:uncharacterized membrane protein YwaF